MTEKLDAFSELFLRWNARINLSAARSRTDLREHIEDCLAVIPFLVDAGRVLDVGSGGGLPVVVAAIHLPAVQFVSLEPVHKKHAFLRTAARELGLGNLDAFAQRVEDHPGENYDVAMSRATFDLARWLDLGATKVRPGGYVLGFEGELRTDLPIATERFPYPIASKTRAIVRFHVKQISAPST